MYSLFITRGERVSCFLAGINLLDLLISVVARYNQFKFLLTEHKPRKIKYKKKYKNAKKLVFSRHTVYNLILHNYVFLNIDHIDR